MLKVDFQLNKEYLARVMISKSRMPVGFANYLWDKYRYSYKKLKKQVNDDTIDKGILDELYTQEFFNDNLKSAENNLLRIKENWNNKQEKIQSFLKTLLRVNIDLKVKAYIIPANLDSGRNIGGNCFIWGHSNGLTDENYDLVYVVHESLHSFFERGNLTHAIIENIADIELAKYLNNSRIGYGCHSFTLEDHVKIYPYWNLYLNIDKQDIALDQVCTQINYDVDAYEKERKYLSSLNINEFVEYLKAKIKKY